MGRQAGGRRDGHQLPGLCRNQELIGRPGGSEAAAGRHQPLAQGAWPAGLRAEGDHAGAAAAAHPLADPIGGGPAAVGSSTGSIPETADSAGFAYRLEAGRDPGTEMGSD